MQDVVTLEMREQVRVDPDRLVELCVSLGEIHAEVMINTKLGELAKGLAEIEEAYLAEDHHKLTLCADQIYRTANQVGMTTLSRVADDVASCSRYGESVPLAATLNRLRRITNRSLSSVWEMQDVTT